MIVNVGFKNYKQSYYGILSKLRPKRIFNKKDIKESPFKILKKIVTEEKKYEFNKGMVLQINLENFTQINNLGL